MKKLYLLISIIFFVSCSSINQLEIGSNNSDFEPKINTWYKLTPGMTYWEKVGQAVIGPAGLQNGIAYNLANEFVFRTSLRKSFSLPACSSGVAGSNRVNHLESSNTLYIVEFEPINHGNRLRILVDIAEKDQKLKILFDDEIL